MKPRSGEAMKTADGMGGVQRRQHPGGRGDLDQPVDRDHREPHQHHRAEEMSDFRGAAPLNEEQRHSTATVIGSTNRFNAGVPTPIPSIALNTEIAGVIMLSP